MITVLENKIETDTCTEVYNYLGIVGVKLKVDGRDGFPDRMFLIPGGKPFFIEFKRPGEDPRPKQVDVHEMLTLLGYTVEVHDDTAEAFESIIKKLDSTRLPKESRKILDRARHRAAVLRSRSWKNVNNACCNKNTKTKRIHR